MIRKIYFRKWTVVALIISLISAMSLEAQQGFTYQAVARNLNGSPITEQALTVRIAIHLGDLDGEIIWGEEHLVETSSLGLFTLMVGDPNALNKTGSAGTFDQIDWSAGTYESNPERCSGWSEDKRTP